MPKLDPVVDAMIAEVVCAEITALATYGYRRAGALVNRTRSLISPKRIDSGRTHDSKVIVAESNQYWCSDGFEIACDNGEVVTGVFIKDDCDRQIIARRARIGAGLRGDPVRDMMIEAV